MARPDAREDVFRAIADPTRRRIIELLAEQPRSPSQLTAAFNSCQSTISEHLRVLRRAGLARFTETAGRRIYYLNAAALDEVAEWADSQRHRDP